MLRFGLTVGILALGAACAQGAPVSRTAADKAAAPAAAAPTPLPTQAQAPVAPPPPPAPAPARPEASTFALTGAGGGSVRVSSTPNGLTSIVVSATGLAAGAHATHVHRGCDGSTAAHLFALSSVYGPSGSSSTTVQVTKPPPGWTVIVYPGPAAVGRPVLCAAIS